MSGNVKSYFEMHAHNYPKSEEFYSKLINRLKSLIDTARPVKLLDVGSGNGSFVRSLLNSRIKLDYYCTDISLNMLRIANGNLQDSNVGFFAADAFQLPLVKGLLFEIIHIDSVLHHLIDSTKGKSNLMAASLVDVLVDRLSDDGVFIVEEVHFGSHVSRQLTSTILFYALKINKFLRFDVSKVIPDLRPGLEVNFLDDEYLLSMLRRHGKVEKVHYESYTIPRSYKIFLLKKYGHSTYILRKKENPRIDI
jgi:SAM-dependent methyltransferase